MPSLKWQNRAPRRWQASAVTAQAHSRVTQPPQGRSIGQSAWRTQLPRQHAVVRPPLPQLLPPPRRLRPATGWVALARLGLILLERSLPDSAEHTARTIAGSLAGALGHLPAIGRGSAPVAGSVFLRLAPLAGPEHYTLEIGADGVVITGGGEPGLFYGAQTLAQLVAQAADGLLPALRIDDGPDYPVRGVYHDISRGKVPTRDTLLELVRMLAHYKINHLQLYLEHTFAFARHPDIWAGADPLTADDIRAIDDDAARHHIELVPSLSTFGHFYTALVSPRKHHLNELPIDASQLAFSWWDRMGHYTLDARQDESLALVREMILELRPLFRSRFFNLCCDETFDLGKGRNAAEAARRGTGRLYLDFLKKLIRVVREADATPMFWGDIVGNHPELVRELPRDVVALDWDYSADLHDTKSRLFRKARVPFYACPGVCGWDRWINDLDTATENILGFARRGRRDGAAGLLNTDWGDRGHINSLGNSAHGMLLGASAAWNTRGTEAVSFDAAFARLELGDSSGRSTALIREAGRLNVVSWRLLTLWLDPTPHRPSAWWDERTGLPADLLAIDPRRARAAATRLDVIARAFARLVPENAPRDPQARRELLLGFRGAALMNRLGAALIALARGRAASRNLQSILALTQDLRRFESEFSAIWHARNRPSEYWRLRAALVEIARRVDLAAVRGVWVKTARPQPPSALAKE